MNEPTVNATLQEVQDVVHEIVTIKLTLGRGNHVDIFSVHNRALLIPR